MPNRPDIDLTEGMSEFRRFLLVAAALGSEAAGPMYLSVVRAEREAASGPGPHSGSSQEARRP